jgi:hypothetical protein
LQNRIFYLKELLTVNFLLPPDVIIDNSANKSASNIPIVEAEEDIDQ